MPKMKTKSGAKKRFKVLGGGGVKRSHAFKRHILTKKASGRKRKLAKSTTVSDADSPKVRLMLPYA